MHYGKTGDLPSSGSLISGPRGQSEKESDIRSLSDGGD